MALRDQGMHRGRRGRHAALAWIRFLWNEDSHAVTSSNFAGKPKDSDSPGMGN